LDREERGNGKLEAPAMPLDSSLVVVAAMAVVLIGLIVSSAFIGFQVGRRTAPEMAPPVEENLEVRQMPEQLLRELHICLDVADCVARDADALAETADRSARNVPRDVTTAITQLRKTLKGLIGRLQQTAGKRLSRTDERRVQAAAERLEKELLLAVDQSSKVSTTAEASTTLSQSENVENHRKFERKPCAGTLKATIYPPPFKSDGQPVQCDVITRDLSCGGVGITHTEQLYPRQLIVLHAVTKVLIGEVRWCQQVGERSFVAGCQLIKTSG